MEATHEPCSDILMPSFIMYTQLRRGWAAVRCFIPPLAFSQVVPTHRQPYDETVNWPDRLVPTAMLYQER